MNLNKSTRYALHAALELALADGSPVTAAFVAERYEIPENVVAKVLQQLVRAGIARGSRGVGGGYRLARLANEVSVQDVIDLFEPAPAPDTCKLRDEPNAPCPGDAVVVGISGESVGLVDGLVVHCAQLQITGQPWSLQRHVRHGHEKTRLREVSGWTRWTGSTLPRDQFALVDFDDVPLRPDDLARRLALRVAARARRIACFGIRRRSLAMPTLASPQTNHFVGSKWYQRTPFR